jgi:adenylate cyclase
LIRRIEKWLARLPSASMRWSIILSLLLFQSLNLYKADTYDRLVGSSYDTLLRKRFVAPETDPSIVILDIDERSLQQMSTDHGRWPWPRDTLASVLEYLEKSGAAAVVFDILFSDEDVINQVADATFADSVTVRPQRV